jgi:peptidyl-prolyl cis-trans isomerase SurA
MGRNGSEHHTNQVFTRSMRRHIVAALVLLNATGVSAAEQLIDRLAAEVNGHAITASEVQSKIQKGPLVEVSPWPAQENDPPAKIAIHDLINKKLIMQKADELDIEVTDEVLNEEIRTFLARRNLTRDQLMEALEEQDMTYDQYREDFRTQMIINQFQGREILPQVKITDRDVQSFYLRHSGSMAENIRLTLRQLQIAVPPGSVDAVKAGKKQLVEKVYQEIEGGMPFEKAVKIYSDNESARENGGLMPQIFLKDLAPLFQNAIRDLEEGRYTRPIETPMGYSIFYVTKREFSGSDDYLKLKPQLENQLRQEEMNKLLGKWLETQRRRSDIKLKDNV